MIDKTMWRYLDTTREVLKAIKAEQESIKEDLASGILLSTQVNNEQLAKEYAANIGYLKGLAFLEEFLKVEEDESNESKTISRKDVSRSN